MRATAAVLAASAAMFAVAGGQQSSSSSSSRRRQQKFGTLADFVLVDNGLYRGEFRAGIPHGRGSLVYFTDDPLRRYNYTGGWDRGRRSGHGTTVFRDGRIYSGQYVRDKPNGRGKITYSNGDVFVGFFSNGKREGNGMLAFGNATADGAPSPNAGGRREGDWSEDKLEGFVFFHWNATSGVSIERWEAGRRVDDGAKERDRVVGDFVEQEEDVFVHLGEYATPANFSRGRGVNMTFSPAPEEEAEAAEQNEVVEAARRMAREFLRLVYDNVQ